MTDLPVRRDPADVHDAGAPRADGSPLTPWVVQAVSAIPVAAVVVLPIVTDGVVDAAWYAAVALVGTALVALGIAHQMRPGRTGRPDPQWHPGYAMACLVLSVPYFAVAVDVAAEVMVLAYATAVVAGAYAMPSAWRLPFGLTAVVAWLTSVALHSSDDAAGLWLHATAALLLVATSTRTSAALAASIAQEAELRQAAERRTALLSELLTAADLDLDVVFGAVRAALEDVGFDGVVVRRVVPGRDDLPLVAGVVPSGYQPIEAVRGDLGVYRGLVAGGGPVQRTGACLGELFDAEGEFAVGVTPDHDRGSCDDAHVVVVPVADAGRLIGTVAAVSSTGEVTESIDDTVVPLMRQLGRAVARAQDFEADERTVEALLEMDRQTQDLVATVSHELRTPLTVVSGLGQTLATRWDTLPDDRRRDLLDRVDANARRLQSMIVSLLDASAIERGELRMDAEVVALRSLVDEVLDRLAPITAVHPVTVAIDPCLEVVADPSSLAHVFENLLANVDKHTPQGTRIAIAAAPCAADRVAVTFDDTGPGIATEDLPHVLERFYRGGDHLQRASSGLGLGLSLVQRVVQYHGSSIEVASPDGGGTSLRFELPLRSPPVAPDPPGPGLTPCDPRPTADPAAGQADRPVADPVSGRIGRPTGRPTSPSTSRPASGPTGVVGGTATWSRSAR